MMRWALTIEYDGTDFVGWQRQAQGVSVQGVLEHAASRLANGAPVTAEAAGRTDAGVHATGQVALLTLPDRYDATRIRQALNFHMRPHAVAIVRAHPAPDGWHPRFSAILRLYRYTILNRPSPSPLNRQCWHIAHPLDIAAMREGAAALHGRHDFTSFRAGACQARSPIRTVDRLAIEEDGAVVTITVEARSFLHHQVRNMVGTLALVGRGVWRASHVAEALAARHRASAGPTAPATGLCLVGVAYPDDPP